MTTADTSQHVPCQCAQCRAERAEAPAIPKTGDVIRHDFAASPQQAPTVNGEPLDGVTRITLTQGGAPSEQVARLTLDMELFPARTGPFVVEGYFVAAGDMAAFREWQEAQAAARRDAVRTEIAGAAPVASILADINGDRLADITRGAAR